MSAEEITALKEQVKTLFNNVGELKEDVKELKEKFANRLPTWATITFSILTALLGVCMGRLFNV